MSKRGKGGGCTFDFFGGFSLDVAEEFFVALAEVLVLELAALRVLGGLVEAVEVELTDKRREVVVLEVLGENLTASGRG